MKIARALGVAAAGMIALAPMASAGVNFRFATSR